MNFYQYKSNYDYHKNDPRYVRLKAIEYYSKFLAVIDELDGQVPDKQLDDFVSTAIQVVSEAHWYSKGRPYYKLFPSILDCFLRLRLDIPVCELDIPEQTILVRMAEDHYLKTYDGNIACILVHVNKHNSKGPPYISFIDAQTTGYCGQSTLSLKEQKTFEQLIRMQIGRLQSRVEQTYRVGLTVLLLANDPSIIQPDVLADDRQRFDASNDPAFRQRLIDKARKRGVVGWRIGEQYETIPHYRRPHPALYHVGKGRHDQRIVFRAGSIVHRQKLTEVPTGYLTEEGEEIEA